MNYCSAELETSHDLYTMTLSIWGIFHHHIRAAFLQEQDEELFLANGIW